MYFFMQKSNIFGDGHTPNPKPYPFHGLRPLGFSAFGDDFAPRNILTKCIRLSACGKTLTWFMLFLHELFSAGSSSRKVHIDLLYFVRFMHPQ